MIIAAVLLVCLFSKTEGATNPKPDDLFDTSKNRSDDFVTSGSGGGNERGQDKPCCISGNFIFHSIDGILSNMSNNTIVNIKTDVVLSSYVTLKGLENIMIIGHRNPVVKCNGVGAVMFISCKNITIEGIQWEGCGSKDYPGVEFYNSSIVSFERCSFHNSKGRSVLLSQVSGNVYINNCNFTHKIEYSGHGAAVHYSPNTNNHGQHKLVVQNSHFILNRATQSVVYIDGSGSRITGHVYLQDNVFVNNIGVPIYISHTNLHISGSVLFKANTAKSGGGIYSKRCSVIFYDTFDVNFISSFVTDNGGANYSRSAFGENSIVTFKDNHARFGGAIYSDNSNITFDGNSSVTFNNNNASDYGGAVHCQGSSHITFDGNSSVTFNNNEARYGGAVYCRFSSYITFDGNSSATFNNNEANHSGGAVVCYDSSTITFDGNSSVTFNNNEARYGGAVYCRFSSYITFDGNSSATFNNNEANHSGGAVFCYDSSNITFDGNSSVTFNNNEANHFGGAVLCYVSSNITFDGNSSVTYSNNFASVIGGAVCCESSSHITFDGSSSVTYSNNFASVNGGAVYCWFSSHITFDDNSSVTFNNNEAGVDGGAVCCVISCLITFDGNPSVTFNDNDASNGGGAIYVLLSGVTFEGDISVNFTSNTAENGGTISAVKSSITFAEQPQLWFFNNSARASGGAIHLSDHFFVNICNNSQITFFHNNANRRGGAIYCDLTKSAENKIIFNSTDIVFDDNTDLTGSDVYVEIPTSCDEMCLNNSLINKRYNHFNGVIKTSPTKLEFKDSAVTCIDNNYTNCQTYLTKNIMLGEEIIINACVKDYYNQPAGPTQFVLSSEDQNHHIIGSNNVLISCEVFGGVSVGGKRILNATNYSMIITSYEGSPSDIREFFIELIIALSPCHPGFHYDNTTQTCVCYSDGDIVSCSGSTSSIKSGYWFGKVDDKATVTICPNNYCNFSCCETANGFFELSPDRANQCNSQRFGTACGGCKDGYTLSFDSIECVSIDKCTTGQILLMVILSVIYWITLVIAVFAMMYYRIGIGYLYAITYYCSIVDIILNQSLETTPALFTTVSIMSSIAKVTPQFLGQFCLIRNMSGIDQQFIHYAHPLAVTFILAMICLSARISYKVSSLVSRGIIHVICFLLLLSYSSVATTSLLIVRPLKFTIGNTVQVKTYLSPDIDYFHGRHLPYAIVAILCTISIAIGLPLLLLFEPFLNRKINFIRIKPLLDQFQGCYKDNCRYFAAYYMVCRLVIIGIFISNFSNNNTTQYLMLAVSALFALVHFVMKPYVNKTLNLFDGLVLLSITFIAMIPLIDRSGLGLLLPVTALLPLVSFAALMMLIHRKNIKKFTKCFKPTPRTTNNNVEVPMREYGVAVDDNMRKNATICEM